MTPNPSIPAAPVEAVVPSDEQIDAVAREVSGCDSYRWGASFTKEDIRAIVRRFVSPAVLVEPAAHMLDPDSDDAQGLAAPEGWWKGLYRGTENAFDLVRFAAGLKGLADHEVLEELERRSVVKAAPSAPLAEAAKASGFDELLSFAHLVLRGLESKQIKASFVIDMDPDAEMVTPKPLAAIARAAIAATQPADHQGEQG